ncbi:class I SAM-dependent methyltransferase [archaeon]|nr:MAG: class I SAM-dependent methyltransferase [archaeon]
MACCQQRNGCCVPNGAAGWHCAARVRAGHLPGLETLDTRNIGIHGGWCRQPKCCLRVAAHTARQEKLGNVRFRQSDASQALLEESSFDLVTSTMFLHEMPPKVLDRVFDECIRVLEPGGRMVHLDFWHLPDPFDRFLHYGHGRRNNEPYMQPLAELDLPAVIVSAILNDIVVWLYINLMINH